MDLKLTEYMLPLKYTFGISREKIDVQPTLILTLSQGQHQGFGETSQNNYYQVNISQIKDALVDIIPLIQSFNFTDTQTPEVFFNDIVSHIPLAFARCCLDQAAHDLYGKIFKVRTYERLGLLPNPNLLTDYTIGIDTIEIMIKKMKEIPWPIYKIKLGTLYDLDIIEALRANTTAIFRVDANNAWTKEQTLKYAPILKKMGVEFIEQPLPANNWQDMKELYEKSPLPIIADESCIEEADVSACKGYFHGINIKLTKCGGITPAYRMLIEAKKIGLKTMVGCMTESTIGIGAIAQLCPLLDYVDMDGPLLLKKDIAYGITQKNGVLDYGSIYGNGVALL